MSDSIPDRPMSNDFHSAIEEVIDAAFSHAANPHRYRVAMKWLEAEEKSDRLARALANSYPYTVHDKCGSCDESIYTRHGPGCVYVWATHHVEALEDQ